jgi:branched-chain amino acid transport system ATP-binding protein
VSEIHDKHIRGDFTVRASSPGQVVLETKALAKDFGGLHAVIDFNLTLKYKELVGLIGPNGAGKTTIFNLLTGVYPPTEGSITLYGESLLGRKSHEIISKGIARTFQNIRLFKELSVLDNVKAAFHFRARASLLDSVLRVRKFREEEAQIEEKTTELLSIFDLESRKGQISKNLPYGEQRKLEIARALATEPGLLLLDEPAAGMNPSETAHLMELIKWIRDRFSLTILLIEHDMQVVMGICERIIVLDYGKTIASGTPSEVRKNPLVIEAYLGEQARRAED